MSKNAIFMHFALMCLTCDAEEKVSRVKVNGHMGQGQRSNWLRSNKGSKQRQVASLRIFMIRHDIDLNLSQYFMISDGN